MVKITMIKVSIGTRELLKKLKIIPRESYDDVLKRLIKFFKERKNDKSKN